MSPQSHLLWLWVLLLQGSSLLGNSYEWIPLQHLPLVTDVVAFANRPADNRQQTLSRAEAMRFLSMGTLHKDSKFREDILSHWTPGQPMISCCGVFITKDGEVYFWTLLNAGVMQIVTGEGRRCCISMPAPGVALSRDLQQTDASISYRRIAAPEADEIRWFFNDTGPSTGVSVQRPKAVILSLIKTGRQVPCTDLLEAYELRKNAWLTMPAAQAQPWRDLGDHTAKQMRGDAIPIDPLSGDPQVQGLIVTRKGKVYYWEQWSDRLLALRDDTGGCRVLQSK